MVFFFFSNIFEPFCFNGTWDLPFFVVCLFFSHEYLKDNSAIKKIYDRY